MVRCQINKDFTDGEVTFEKTEGATKALNFGNHYLFDSVVAVTAAIYDSDLCCYDEELVANGNKHSLQSIADLNTISNMFNTTSITDLNDDCLTFIFRMLPLKDLSAAYNTCMRLRSIAKVAFPINFGNIVLRYIPPLKKDSESKFDGFQAWTPFDTLIENTIDSVFTEFGGDIIGLELRGVKGDKQKKIARLIPQYCTDSLKSLTLRGFHFDHKLIIYMRVFLINLKSLSLDACTFDESHGTSFFSLLAACKNLTNLEFHAGEFSDFPSFVKCPQLECLKIHCKTIRRTEYVILQAFLKQQKNLKELQFICNYKNDSSILVNIIADYCCENLRSLDMSLASLAFDVVSVSKMSGFSKWEELKVIYWNPGAGRLFSKCKNLVSLRIPFRILGALRIADFPQLRNLELKQESSSIKDMPSPAEFLINQPLNNLNSIKFDHDVDIPLNFIKAIAQNCSGLQFFECLDIGYYFNSRKLRVLGTFDNIKTLRIRFVPYSTENDFTARRLIDNIHSIDTLHHLELFGDFLDNSFIVEIARLKNLRYLELADEGSSYAGLLLQLEPIGELKHLSTFKLSGKWIISEDDLIRLVTKLEKLTLLGLCVDRFMLGTAIYNKINEIVHGRHRTIRIMSGCWIEIPSNDQSILHIERDVDRFN